MRKLTIATALAVICAAPAWAQLEVSGNNVGQGAGGGAATNFWNFRLTDGTTFYDGLKVGQLPASLVGGRLDVNTGTWLGSTAPTVGQKTMANSVPVVLASDHSVFQVQSNSANIATEATLSFLAIAQGSTTSGQKGPLVFGAVTTAAPTYTTAQSSPLSLDTGSGLRVSPVWPFPIGDWHPVSDTESLRFKVFNSAGCPNSLQTCESLQIMVRGRFVRASNPYAAPIYFSKVLTYDNDRAASGGASGGASFPLGAAAGRGRSVADATTPGASININACTLGNPTTITLASGFGFPTGQIVAVNITGSVCSPSVAGPWLATITGSTTFTIAAITTGSTGVVGSVFSSNILQSATVAYTSADVGRTVTSSAGGVVCTASDSPCQGPKFPGNITGVTWMGTIVGIISGTQAQVKPSLLSSFTNATIKIEPALNEDGTSAEIGKGWITDLDINFWQNGQQLGRTFVEAELNSNTAVPASTHNMHMGFSFVCDYMATSEHLSWPGSRTCRHKIDGPGWTRLISFGATGGSNAITITNITAANPAVVTSSAHGMTIGAIVLMTISGTNSTPNINGLRYATVLSTTTFSVPVDTSGGAGNAGSFVGPYATPAAGADWTATVPLNAKWRIRSIRAVYVANATVINRMPAVIIDDATGTILPLTLATSNYIAAGQTHTIVWAPGIDTRAIQTPVGNWQDYVQLPQPTELTAGMRIRVSTTNIQGTDAWSSIVLEVEELEEEGAVG